MGNFMADFKRPLSKRYFCGELRRRFQATILIVCSVRNRRGLRRSRDRRLAQQSKATYAKYIPVLRAKISSPFSRIAKFRKRSKESGLFSFTRKKKRFSQPAAFRPDRLLREKACKTGHLVLWLFVITSLNLTFVQARHSPRAKFVSPAAAAHSLRQIRQPLAAMVVDGYTGKVLYDLRGEELRYPASLTKVMTLYLVFEQMAAGRWKADTLLPVSAHAAVQPPTKIGLQAGGTIAVEDAIKALVTRSANDAAVVVAEAIGGSEEAFAQLMTRKAQVLGMQQTIFRNASGLPHPQHNITSARDMIILGKTIQEHFPKFYTYFSLPSFSYNGAEIRNHNRLLNRLEGVDGIKTGYTRASGFNLLSSFKSAEGHRIFAVVLGGVSSVGRDRLMHKLILAAYAHLRAPHLPLADLSADLLPNPPSRVRGEVALLQVGNRQEVKPIQRKERTNLPQQVRVENKGINPPPVPSSGIEEAVKPSETDSALLTQAILEHVQHPVIEEEVLSLSADLPTSSHSSHYGREVPTLESVSVISSAPFETYSLPPARAVVAKGQKDKPSRNPKKTSPKLALVPENRALAAEGESLEALQHLIQALEVHPETRPGIKFPPSLPQSKVLGQPKERTRERTRGTEGTSTALLTMASIPIGAAKKDNKLKEPPIKGRSRLNWMKGPASFTLAYAPLSSPKHLLLYSGKPSDRIKAAAGPKLSGNKNTSPPKPQQKLAAVCASRVKMKNGKKNLCR